MSSINGVVPNSAAPPAVQQPVAQPKTASNPFLSLPLPESIKTDLNDLSTALQKGNMDAATTAFSNLIADMNGHYQSTSDDSTISLLG